MIHPIISDMMIERREKCGQMHGPNHFESDAQLAERLPSPDTALEYHKRAAAQLEATMAAMRAKVNLGAWIKEYLSKTS